MIRGSARGPVSWLLFADLDGTLIVEPGGIGPKLVELIEFAAESGGRFIPATARPVPHLARMFEACDPGSYAIGSGGAVIAKLGAGSYEVIREEVLDPEAGREFLRALWRWHDEEGGVAFFFQSSRAHFEVGVAGAGRRLDSRALAKIVGSRPMREVKVPPAAESLLGVSLLAPCEPDRLLPLKSSPLLPGGWRASVYPEYRVPGWSWCEVFPGRASKAEAVRRVRGFWQGEAVGAPATIAVGDAIDDIGMFELVGTSFCPWDGSEQARAAASEVLAAAGGEAFAAAVLARIKHLLRA